MTYVPAKINTEYIFYVGLPSQANALTLQANPTLSAGDVKRAIDDGAPVNLTTLPVVDGDFTKRVKVNLSSAEMNGDNITVIFSDAAGDEWCDLIVNIQTAASQIDDIQTDLTFLKDIEGGMWERDGVQMIFYKSDNATEVARFNLFKFNGAAAQEKDDEVAKRERV